MNQKPSIGIELIATERARQVSQENWTPEHDDAHISRELARAGLAYLSHYAARGWVFTNELQMPGVADGRATYKSAEAPDAWPWDAAQWNPQNPLRDLVKAGALITAEIDRLMRAKLLP